MSKYTVRVEADKALYPVLLSNGTETARGEPAGGATGPSSRIRSRSRATLALVAANLQGIKAAS